MADGSPPRSSLESGGNGAIPFGRDDYPALYAAASAAARSNQQTHTRASQIELGLLLLTSGLIAFDGWNWIHDHDYGTYIRIAIAASLISALLIKGSIRHRRFDSKWFEARSVAEAVKSQSWQYMMRVPPYNGSEAAAHNEFRQQFNSLLRLYPAMDAELHRLPTDRPQVTDGMRAVRAASLDERRATYAAKRVRDQIHWYRDKSQASKAMSSRWFMASFGVQLLAILLAIVVVGVGSLPILQLSVAISIAFTALNRSGRYEDRTREYGVAAQELSLLCEALDLADDQEQLAETVREIEAVIGKEHSAWFARRT